MNKDKVDVYQAITDKIIAELERGVAPWLAPWNSSKAIKLGGGDAAHGWQPRNALSGRRYNGINVLLCWLHMNEFGLDSTNAQYMTYRQAQGLGGHIKAGSKACQIVLWKDAVRTETVDGQQVKRKYLYATSYNVFHIQQTEGVELPALPEAVQPVGLTDDNAWSEFIAATKCDLRHGGDRAYYAMQADYIQMPVAASFRSAEHYKATALHELTHWTGHKDRMAREFGRRFGDNAYAVEELVAEMGAAFLCADHGIANPEMRHAAYIETWLRALRGDNCVIITASSQASKAAQYIDALVTGASAPAVEQIAA
jgi:antirestriction protein ArdC